MRHASMLIVIVPLLAVLESTSTATAYYSPRLGRFISRDPIAEKGGVNLYGYVTNDPVRRTDSFGLCCCFRLHDKFDRVCATISNPKGRCTGTATLHLGEGAEMTRPLDLSLEEIAQQLGTPGELVEDCKTCSTKCLPLPILIIIPIEKDIEYSGTYEVDQDTFLGHFRGTVPYTARLHCKIEGTWLILWTCCRAGSG